MATRKDLKQEEVEFLLELIAEGLSTPEIIKSCEESGFIVTRQQVRYYRYHKKDDISKMQKEYEADAFQVGLARRKKRIEALSKLFKRLEAEIEAGGLWIKRTRAIRDESGEGYLHIEEFDFNASLIREFRLTIDDIAKEVGGRIDVQSLTPKDIALKAYVKVSPDDWPEPPTGEKESVE